MRREQREAIPLEQLLFYQALWYTHSPYSDSTMASYEKPDFWSIKAQKEHYPARSVYKLKEIDEKFNFFKTAPRLSNAPHMPNVTTALRVLDLGAAPGSWSLYMLRRYGNASLFLAAADLLPLSQNALFDRENFFFVQGDFTSAAVREELVRRGPYSAVISDAAPGTTGSRTVDTLRSLNLAETVLAFAEECLAPGGNLLLKIFQGGSAEDLLKRLRAGFNNARSFKPVACRSSSFETYYAGLGKRER
jgi:23S rRNA (uridine2552-2'-O)-methyltransferase